MKPIATLLLALLCWQPTAWAADLVVPVQKGEPAPANGYWLSEEAYKEALEQSAWFRKLLERRELELASLREQLRVRLASQQEQAKIERDALEAKLKAEIDELKKREIAKDAKIADLENPPWWKTAEFHRVVGFAAAVLSFYVGKGLLGK